MEGTNMFIRSLFLVSALVSSPAFAGTHIIHSAEDIDAVCRVMFAEARNQGALGKIAFVEVIINRLRSGAYGESVPAVLEQKHAFEPVMRSGGSWRNLPPLSLDDYDECRKIIDLKNGDDITRGATHFQNVEIVRDRAKAGKVKPTLVGFNGMPAVAKIGDHTFYAGQSIGSEGFVVENVTSAQRESSQFGDYDSSIFGGYDSGTLNVRGE